MDLSNSELQLHTFFRSTSSARVRIAANLKKIPLKYVYVNLRQAEQNSEDFATISPNRTVPVLTVSTSDAPSTILIRQSIAILDFFEEAFPSSQKLLPPPSDVIGRAKVRELVQIIACDVQPPTNQRILKRIKQYDTPPTMEDWAREIMGAGLAAFDKLAESCAGQYCYGDEITLADVVLVLAVENATRYGVNIATLPTIAKVYEKLSRQEAFQAGNWRNQGDTPEEERSS